MSDEQRGEQAEAQEPVLDTLEQETPEQESPAQKEPKEPKEQQGSFPDLENLKGELENLKSVLGRQGEELGSLRNENAFLKSRVPQQGPQQPYGFQQPQSYPQQQPAESTPEDYDWTDPKSVQRIIRQELGQYHRMSQQERASGALTRGQAVVHSNPEYFKGIESEVSQLVQGWYNMNPGVAPEMLENPQTWYGAADLIKGQKTRTTPRHPSVQHPVSPTQTEQPDATKPREPEDKGERVDFDRGAESLIDAFYEGDVEAAKKDVRDIRADRARRNR